MANKTKGLGKGLSELRLEVYGAQLTNGDIYRILKACKEAGLMFAGSSLGASHPHLVNYCLFEEIEVNA